MRACLCHLQGSCPFLTPPKEQGAFLCQTIKIPVPSLPGDWFSAQETWGCPCSNVRVWNIPSHSALSSEACRVLWLGRPTPEQVSR